jgi:hypothetical protein
MQRACLWIYIYQKLQLSQTQDQATMHLPRGKPEWIDSAACMICCSEFGSFFPRPHHCRYVFALFFRLHCFLHELSKLLLILLTFHYSNCGNCVCGDCSPHVSALPHIGYHVAERVCSVCHPQLSRANELFMSAPSTVSIATSFSMWWRCQVIESMFGSTTWNFKDQKLNDNEIEWLARTMQEPKVCVMPIFLFVLY